MNHGRKMDITKELDVEGLHDRLMRAWMNQKFLNQQELAKQIGISQYALRGFIQKTGRNFTTPTKMRILAWVENIEKLQKESE